MKADQIIRCIQKSKVVPNENTVVPMFWEQLPGTGQIENNVNPIKEIINLVNKARNTIYLFSPKVTSSELRKNLLFKSKEGVKTYVLTSALDTHVKNKLLAGIEMAREKSDICSTFVVIDPKTESAEGIWFPGELTKNQVDLPFVLHLTEDQAREMWAHFSYWFWRAEGTEVAKEKVRPGKQFLPAPPDVHANLAHTFRTENLEETFGAVPASKLWLTENRPDGMDLFCIDVNEVAVPLSSSSQPLIETIKDTAENIFGNESFPFNFGIYSRKKILFASDLGFVLDRDQASAFENIYGNWTWKFNNEGRMGDINQSIRLIETAGVSGPVDVCDNQTIELERVSCKNFDDWHKGGITPEIPQNIIFSRSITYQWNVCPPLLPEDAKKHPLYGKWENFIKEVREYAGSLIRNLEKAEASMEGLQKITHAKQFSEWRQSVEKFAQLKWEIQTKESAESLLDEFSHISTAIQGKLTDLQKDAETSQDEFKVSSQGKKSGSHITGTMNLVGDIKKLKEKIPRKPVPSIGMLYSKGPNEYFAITDVNQIEQGKTIAREFPAELVAKPEERND